MLNTDNFSRNNNKNLTRPNICTQLTHELNLNLSSYTNHRLTCAYIDATYTHIVHLIYAYVAHACLMAHNFMYAFASSPASAMRTLKA